MCLVVQWADTAVYTSVFINIKYFYNIYTMLEQRPRRRADVIQML